MTTRSRLSPEIIELGKALVAHLADEKRGRDDLLSKWMAHDIAAKIATAQADPSNVQAQSDCALAIFQLWEHRTVFPQGKRLTDYYEGILQTLERLNPAEVRSFYLSEQLKPPGEEDRWLNAAISFDRTARILIKYVLKQAADRAEGGIDWSELTSAAGLAETPDLTVLRLVLSGETDSEMPDAHTAERQRLQGLLSELANFQKMSHLLAATLTSDLEALDRAGAAHDDDATT